MVVCGVKLRKSRLFANMRHEFFPLPHLLEKCLENKKMFLENKNSFLGNKKTFSELFLSAKGVLFPALVALAGGSVAFAAGLRT